MVYGMERHVWVDELADLLALSTLTVATTSADGQPHAAPVYFAAVIDSDAGSRLRLYFFSEPDSQHGRDAATNPRAAAALYPLCYDWQDIRGLQMRGSVQAVEPGEEWEQAWEQYQSKFPFVSSLKEIVARNTLYVFVPNWVRLVDNRRGFGTKQEWEFP